jgi:single-strand DNA-binding protein
MSNDLNSCSFIGRLGRDPETRYMASGDAVTNFSIAVGESWKDKDSGEKKETVEWVRCVAWRKLAEICAEYLKKGSQVYVSGKMKTREWEDKEGVKRYSTEIVVDKMQMLGGKRDGEAQAGEPAQKKPETKKTGGKFDDMEDDIPF